MDRRAFLATSAAAAIAATLARANGTGIALNGALAFVDVELPGGDRAPFLLDTGAAITVIDPEALKRAIGEISRGLRLGVGGQFRTVMPAIRDLSPVSAALKQKVSGLLGSDFLSVFQAVADYPDARLILKPGGQPRPANGMPMRFAGLPYVQAEVRHGRGVLHGEFGLDTGLDSGVKIRDSITLPMMRLSTTMGTTLTVEGSKSVASGTVDALRIGGLDVPNLSAIVTQDPPPGGAGGTYAGMIGAPAFRGRILTIDYPGQWWSISPLML